MSDTLLSPRTRLPSNPPGLNLAAAWYVAMPSGKLRSRPLAVELFGEQLVAWRDGSGRPSVMPRFCPHQGASLAIGAVVDGELRCPFHHWRFDSDGACVAVPGVRRIPPTARVRAYPTAEKYGLVWVWYGTPEPLYDVPDFPPLTTSQGDYIGFTYSDDTTGTVRHLLENAIDYYHFLTLHGLVMEDVTFRVLRDQDEARANGAPLAEDKAWFGVHVGGTLLKWNPIRHPVNWVSSFMSTFGKGGRFEILVDGWPGGQRFTTYVNGQEIYKVLMGTTPTSDRKTAQVGWAGVRRTGQWWKTLLYLILFYAQNRGGTAQDVPIYNTTYTNDSAKYVRYDSGVIKFRNYYQAWVQRAQDSRKEGGRRNEPRRNVERS